MVVFLSTQYSENTDYYQFFPSADFIAGLLLVIPLERQGKRDQPFSRTQPFLLSKALSQYAVVSFLGRVIIFYI